MSALKFKFFWMPEAQASWAGPDPNSRQSYATPDPKKGKNKWLAFGKLGANQRPKQEKQRNLKENATPKTKITTSKLPELQPSLYCIPIIMSELMNTSEMSWVQFECKMLISNQMAMPGHKGMKSVNIDWPI